MEFDELFMRHWPLVVSVTQRVLRDRTAAEDAASEAFCRVWAARDTIRAEEGDELAWKRVLTVAARRIALDEVMRGRRRGKEGVSFLPLDEASDVAGPQGGREDWFDLKGVIDSLPETQRTALVLSAAGYRDAEIARLMDTTPLTVRQHAFRGRRRLNADRPVVRKVGWRKQGGILPEHQRRRGGQDLSPEEATERRRAQWRAYRARKLAKKSA